ncbi:Ig-like domain repeat protein [Nocardioides sp. CPCC 206347]|uniref:Ig-like domain repeat protein n=1 Tax=Nocardioides sp. CPCC 206347 TaxID=3406463 RepID=UPI003B436A1B
MPLAPTNTRFQHRFQYRGRRAADAFRRRMARLIVLATLSAGLVALAGTPVATAVQATGDDVAAWNTGWSWTYQTTFRYIATGTDVTLNENVTYTVGAVETFQGQSAYRLDITGTITGGSGTAVVDGVGTANLSNFAGSVSGTKYVRRSDLALLRETQQQNLTGKAQVSIITQNITAAINLEMTPQRGWRALAFPLEAGQSWSNDVDVDYDGGFSYAAGSLASGNDTFEGVFSFSDPSTVSNATVAVPIGSVNARRVHAQSADGQTVNTHWWSPTHRNDAQEILRLPVDDGSLSIDRKLASSSTPAAATTLTGSITPSLTCAGGDVTVAGKLSTGAAGVPVVISLDKSPVTPGQTQNASVTTTSGGNYTATLSAPAESDGLAKGSARASWGVIVSAAGATTASTLVVTNTNCSTLAYTGATSAAQGSTATVKAVLVDLAGGPVAGRTVTFSLAGGATATATTSATGLAQTDIAVAGPPRTTTITASYAGGGGLEPASTSAPFTVGAIPTSTVVTADPAVVTVGDPVRFTATVSPAHGSTPGGAVQFRVDGSDFGAAIPLTDGAATSPALSTLGLGNHTVVAVYAGTSDHGGSTSAAVTFRVREPLLTTTTTSSVDPGTAVYGQPVTLSATVTPGSGTPTGEVIFTVSGDEVGRDSVDANGDASVVVSDLAVGSNQVVATYSGDDVYDASAASPRNVTVNKAAVTVALSATDTTTVTGEAVGHTATVAVQAPGGGSPNGTVQLLVDGNAVGAAVDLTNGSATFPPLTSLTAGEHTVSASYSGSGRYLAGSDQVEHDVAPAVTTVALLANPSPSVQDQPILLTASVAAVSPGSGSPSGTVTFLADGEPVGSAPVTTDGSGTRATLDLTDLAPGSYQLTARYAGDADYTASESAPVSHTVIEGTAVVETTTVLTSSANPSTYGELITFSAQVTAADDSTPAGSVQFSVDGQDVGGPVAVGNDGVAESPTLGSPDPGDHTVIAAFSPEPGFSGSGDILTQTVAAAGVDIDLQSSNADAEAGDEVRFTAEVSSPTPGTGTPTGYVQFAIDGQPFGDAVELEDGSATSPVIDDLAPGNHTVTALYSGDVHFRSDLVDLTQSVALVATTTVLTVSPGSATYGDTLTLKARVTPAHGGQGVPAGSVRFLADGVEIGTVPLAPDGSAGVAQLATAALPAGTHHLRAVYDGTDAHDASDSAVVDVTVAKRATTVQAAAAAVSLTPLGLPLGQLRATVTTGGQPLAGVAVEFKVGTKVVCTTTTNGSGVATCNAAAQLLALVLNGGYTATFGGDANHLSSTARGAIIK